MKMKERKAAKVAPTRVPVSTPETAVSLLREFVRSAANDAPTTPVKGSKARWYTADSIVAWYLRTQNKYIHKGWLGRCLHAAVNSGMRGVIMSSVKTEDGRTINVYR